MISPISTATIQSAGQLGGASPKPPQANDDTKLRQAFDSFVGETFYSQMLKSMRKTQDKPAYFHGGHAEEVFQQQFDQVLAEKLSSASSDKFTGPMYELFTMQRR
jgi:peptidoglycan hydrolase FlgJ